MERYALSAITTAAVLARGLGSRMRRPDADSDAALSAEQRSAADMGLKAMMPVGRPFLDHALTALADAGITEVVLVVPPEHEAIRQYYTRDCVPQRLRLHFAVQEQPLGTADAVVAAARVIGDRPFLVVNGDNLYPVDAVHAVAHALPPSEDTGPPWAATAAFDRGALIADGSMEPERIGQFAVMSAHADGELERIIEKPAGVLDLTSAAARWVSMNLWAATPALVEACRTVPRSTRGEYELPDAVQRAVNAGTLRVRVVPVAGAVLDLSSRRDVPLVRERLAQHTAWV